MARKEFLKVTALAVFTLAAGSGSALADVITVPLAGLVGDYQGMPDLPPGSGEYSRTLTFTLPPELTAIEDLRLVISGTWADGLQWCEGPSGPESSPFTAEMALVLSIPAASEDFFTTFIQLPDGDITDLQGTVRACCPPDILALDQLLGTTIEAELFVGWVVLGICAVESDTYGSLTDVHLEVTGSVPADATTWSEVKALYR